MKTYILEGDGVMFTFYGNENTVYIHCEDLGGTISPDDLWDWLENIRYESLENRNSLKK